MTLPLDTHLENSRSHYYEFPAYIDPIFIAIVPRLQERHWRLLREMPCQLCVLFSTNEYWAVHCPQAYVWRPLK